MWRSLLFLFLASCGGVVSADPKPAPACVIEAGAVDCTDSDCHALHDSDGSTLGTTVRGQCASADRCIVWIDAAATYGVCR